MGCDGGTIPRRDELVRLKKKPEQKDKDAEREFRWLHCALTQQRLQEPIVMCGLGRLYSKQNVIEQLLEKDKMPEAVKHIKNMKDIKELNLTPNPAFTEEDKTEGLLDTRHAPYVCKLIGLEMSGKFRFVGLWTCGCVMSERALKEIKCSSSGTCPSCQQPFAVEDVIVLNASDEDLELMKVKIEMRQAKKKASKKDKKDKKSKVNGAELEVKEETKSSSETQDPNLPSTSKSAAEETTSSESKVNGASTSSSSQSVKHKLVANPKRLGITSGALEDPEIKRLKTDYSVAKDPKASDVYKSLFTSHKSEQEQTRAHWVTYNPFYN
ncbi:replication termination factor 2 [Calliphora vicina]|uniref:replication termination factor 2 n=1 Tax=Calliphora vicina TaxID=7373 RepID=UPI00325B6D55